MVQCIIIEKSGNIISKKLKNEEKKYTLCNYKNNNDFKLLHIYKNISNNQNKEFEIYGKEKGRANSENKYELPPPLDSDLFFGSMAVVTYRGIGKETQLFDCTEKMWTGVYNKLMGGFEDLHSEEEEEEEEEYVPPEKLTKHGYKKLKYGV